MTLRPPAARARAQSRRLSGPSARMSARTFSALMRFSVSNFAMGFWGTGIGRSSGDLGVSKQLGDLDRRRLDLCGHRGDLLLGEAQGGCGDADGSHNTPVGGENRSRDAAQADMAF